MNNHQAAPEFDSIEAFIAHERASIEGRTAAVVARAVAEYQGSGVDVSPAAQALLAERVHKMLTDRVDEMAASLAKQL